MRLTASLARGAMNRNRTGGTPVAPSEHVVRQGHPARASRPTGSPGRRPGRPGSRCRGSHPSAAYAPELRPALGARRGGLRRLAAAGRARLPLVRGAAGRPPWPPHRGEGGRSHSRSLRRRGKPLGDDDQGGVGAGVAHARRDDRAGVREDLGLREIEDPLFVGVDSAGNPIPALVPSDVTIGGVGFDGANAVDPASGRLIRWGGRKHVVAYTPEADKWEAYDFPAGPNSRNGRDRAGERCQRTAASMASSSRPRTASRQKK